MPNAHLHEILKAAGERMAGDLKLRLVKHPGELGVAREEIIREFLRANLPKKYEISSGFIFDANGQLSDQLDIIISDADASPGFSAPGGVRFYPCETVLAVGQVRTNVSSRKEMLSAINNLQSASQLDRSANGRAVCTRTGAPIDQTTNHLHRIFTFLLILERALDGQLTREVLLEVVQRSESHLWPNVIVALDRYLITYCCDGGVCPNTLDARGISLLDGQDFSARLIRLYVYLSQAISVTSVSQVSSFEYLIGLLPRDGDVIYSVAILDGEPPPYLSSLPGAF